MTEIKTLIATEEPLEKQVSQVNLSQAYLSGQVCSCLVRMKKVVVRVFFLWIKSACLSAVCRAKQLDQQGGRTMGEPISASKHGFGQLMFHSHVRMLSSGGFPSWTAANTVCDVRQHKEKCLCLWSLLPRWSPSRERLSSLSPWITQANERLEACV